MISDPSEKKLVPTLDETPSNIPTEVSQRGTSGSFLDFEHVLFFLFTFITVTSSFTIVQGFQTLGNRRTALSQPNMRPY